jgi:ubiquinone/menaquinone biosynthesis C-methylase UbiE
MFKRSALSAVLIIAAALAAPHHLARAQTGEPSAHHGFSDVEHWAKVFESPERNKWQKPDEVVRELNLKPGETVVDIGAGTGYFTRRFAAAVGPSGRAIGLDVEPAMVAYMRKDAARLGLKNYEARVVKPDGPELAADSVDLIFLCDTFHHLENRSEYFHRLIPALKPDGRIAIVDFQQRPTPVGPPAAMKVSLGEVQAEMKSAGYKMTRVYGFLPYQYFAEFEPRESSRRAGE